MILPVGFGTGTVSFVPASAAIAPFTYMGSLKLDARGRIVTTG